MVAYGSILVLQPGSSPNLLDFYGGFITKAVLVKSPATGGWFNLQLLAPTWKSGSGTESSISFSMVGFLDDQPPSLGTFQNHLMNTNPGVLEWGLLWTRRHPFHLSGSEQCQDLRTKDNIVNKRYCHCIYGSGNSKGLGSYEPGTIDMKTIYMENIFCSSEQADTCSL